MPSRHETVLCRYHYDPLDCLIGLKSSVQVELQRFYCKSRLATEIQGQSRCSIVQQGDQLLAQQQRLGDTLETDLLATDQQRSVMHTVGGSPLPIVYSPYGHRRVESGLTSLLGFNGERPDAITGHYLLGNGYRAFNPVLMRFNSPDSLSPFGKGGLNSYAYCLGDPVNRDDQSGRFSAPWIVNAASSFVKSRASALKRMPWYSWSSGDIDIAKHVTRSSGPFSTSDFQTGNLFRSKFSGKGYSTEHIQPLEPRIGKANLSETLFKKSSNAIDGAAVVTLRNQHKSLARRVDESYFRSDFMKLSYERKIKNGFPSAELFSMPEYGDFERHSNLMKAVNLEVALRFATSERQRSLIKVDLNCAVKLNKIFRRTK